MKNWEFGKEAPQIFYPARSAVFEDTVRARDEKYGGKPTPPKTNFSSCLDINAEKSFVIVITSYNNSDWYEQNLGSVFSQRYDNYRVIYVDDGSTDGTADLVEEFVKQSEQEKRFTFIRNIQQNGPLACVYQAVTTCDKEEIVVDLDGNDWLAHDEVLQALDRIYSEEDVWMTYGQFMTFPGFTKGFAKKVPDDVIAKNNFRSHGGSVTHLRTFYAWLFHRIKQEDLFFQGKFIERAGDLAYSTPISEMAGAHTRFVPEVLYIYNNSRPINHHKVSNNLEAQMDRFVRSKEKYAPLSGLVSSILPDVYSQITDLLHPTISDYRLVQEYLSQGQRKNIERLNDMEPVVREMKIIGSTPDEFPKSGIVSVNCSKSDKENCILLYATFNRNYPNGLRRLLKHIVESDFKGHVLYRLGGWPDAEGGSLSLAHVPYAFKVSFFKEARRLGYKRALWLDTAVVPLVSLNDICTIIETNGYFVMGNSHMVGKYTNAPATAYFNLSPEDTFQIPSCSAGLFGVDFTQDLGSEIIERWYKAAQDKDAFFSARSDQNALSIILHQLGATDLVPLAKMPEKKWEIMSDSLFWLDREFVHGY